MPLIVYFLGSVTFEAVYGSSRPGNTNKKEGSFRAAKKGAKTSSAKADVPPKAKASVPPKGAEMPSAKAAVPPTPAEPSPANVAAALTPTTVAVRPASKNKPTTRKATLSKKPDRKLFVAAKRTVDAEERRDERQQQAATSQAKKRASKLEKLRMLHESDTEDGDKSSANDSSFIDRLGSIIQENVAEEITFMEQGGPYNMLSFDDEEGTDVEDTKKSNSSDDGYEKL